MSAPTTSPPRSDDTTVSSARILLGRTLAPQSRNYLLVLGTTLFLVGVGLVMVLSSSSVDSFLDNKGFFGGFWKQATYAVLGIPLMLVISRIPVSFWKRWAWLVLAAGLILQMLVFTPLGFDGGGNRNWIALGPINGQPSELLKLALAIWLGAILGRKMELLSNWKHALIPVFPVAAIALGLVLAGQDLGTVVIMAGLVIGAMFFANVRLRFLAVPVAAGLLLFVVMAILSPNRMARIMTFLDDECLDYENLCWQPLHGTWALANGGVFGLGLGNSREKYSWLPAASNDYIFAIIGEELGLIGAVVVLVMFVLLAVGFVRIIRRSSDPFVRITTGAILVWIIGQAFVNIGVVLRLLPVLGVPLPFISAGGTALLTSLAAIGIVLAFAREQASPARPAPEGRFRS
ncbi:MAG TPA: putative lipid II flippase FtsW [Mycetocola sp.]|jgi:cell division protein FtsW|uniref:putative lipid II flippase FtsW n=1 Tax=Mycetocola sp. TaxID=1871042 RepID=UPI002631F7A8|nr:putative lipid II flippase FtsW [Mycetocola sp.]MCU1560668.1 ftsW [Mycetocola sp.]HEV7848362.1 putative lipid II flippase FtsW [Mycetocola sp.]